MSKILDLWSDMTGVVLDYALSTPPSDKWLMCYGQALLSTDTAAARLRAKLLADGSPYGADGSGNPFVPDARGRAVAGKDDMGGVSASRLTSGGAGVDGATLGAAGGSQTHTLTTAQMPSHNHGVNDPGHGHGVTDPGHAHANPVGVASGGYGMVTDAQVSGAIGYADPRTNYERIGGSERQFWRHRRQRQRCRNRYQHPKQRLRRRSQQHPADAGAEQDHQTLIAAVVTVKFICHECFQGHDMVSYRIGGWRR